MLSPARRPFVPICRRHLPFDRAILHEQGGWQVLVAPRNTAGYTRAAASGALFLQLWSPSAQVSVLLPASKTDFEYELLLPDGRPVRMGCYKQVAHVLQEQLSLTPLPDALITRLYMGFILTSMVGSTVPR